MYLVTENTTIFLGLWTKTRITNEQKRLSGYKKKQRDVFLLCWMKSVGRPTAKNRCVSSRRGSGRDVYSVRVAALLSIGDVIVQADNLVCGADLNSLEWFRKGLRTRRNRLFASVSSSSVPFPSYDQSRV